VNKPMGVVSTNSDPSGRPRVIDLFPNFRERLFTVGRLDLSSEGLMLVTNDGQLAHELAHPRFGVEKTYQVLVAGQPGPDVLAQLRQGVRLAEGVARVVRVRVKSALKKSTVLEIVLAEGRNREIRRLLAKVGHKVLRLKRVALGGVKLKDLPPGEFRRLRSDELRLLRQRSKPEPKRPTPEHAIASTEAPAKIAAGGARIPQPRPFKKSGSRGAAGSSAERGRRHPEGQRPAGRHPAGRRPKRGRP